MLRQQGDRRRRPRHPAGLTGTYRLVDDENSAWKPCTVVDLSTIGAGLELFGNRDDALAGRSLVLRVHDDDGEPSGVLLRGEIRRVEHGTNRVGIEFVWLSSVDAAVVAVLVRRLLDRTVRRDGKYAVGARTAETTQVQSPVGGGERNLTSTTAGV